MKHINTSCLGWLLVCATVIVSLSCVNTLEPQYTSVSSKSGRLDDGTELNSVPTGAYTVRYKFQQYQSQAVNTGGTEGLVNTKVSAYTAFTEMANGSDRVTYRPLNGSQSGLIQDQDGNTWVLYIPSQASRDEFATKGYTVKKGIDWSSGPDQPSPPQKLRFTID